uniref:Uncharacterized protein n=1 Tax=Anguilla anguilla TaxID=7936 RepID=A0A0E9V270_ANGAN
MQVMNLMLSLLFKCRFVLTSLTAVSHLLLTDDVGVLYRSWEI